MSFPDKKTSALIAGALHFDCRQEIVTLDRDRVHIRGKSLRLLYVLMVHSQTVLTKEQLIEKVWDGRAVSDSVLTTAMKELRKALKDTAKNPHYIQTLHGRGYRFLQPVQTVRDTGEKVSSDAREGVFPTETIQRPRAQIFGLAILAVFGIAFLAWFFSDEQKPAGTGVPSIAVLPFDDFSASKGNKWFADGLVEEILNALAQEMGLKVLGRNMVFDLSDRGMTAEEISEQLNVDYILEGSVRFSEDSVRVIAQLIETNDQSHLWSKVFEEPHTNAFQIQERIALAIADSLGVTIDPVLREQMFSAGTSSPAAYEKYLQGIALYYGGMRSGTKNYETDLRMADLFEEALAADPEFTKARGFIARIWQGNILPVRIGTGLDSQEFGYAKEKFLLHINHLIQSTPDRARKALYIAEKATVTMEFQNKYREAKVFQEAYPTSIRGFVLLAESAIALGNFAEAKQAVSQTLPIIQDWKTDAPPPSPPVTLATFAGDPELAVQISEAILASYPEHAFALHGYHRAALELGQNEKARDILRRVLASNLPQINKHLATMRQYCSDRNLEAALGEYAEIERLSIENEDVSPRWLALTLLGKREEANASLEVLNNEERVFQLAGFLVYPHFDRTRFDQIEKVLVRESAKFPPVKLPAYSCP